MGAGYQPQVACQPELSRYNRSRSGKHLLRRGNHHDSQLRTIFIQLSFPAAYWQQVYAVWKNAQEGVRVDIKVSTG